MTKNTKNLKPTNGNQVFNLIFRVTSLVSLTVVGVFFLLFESAPNDRILSYVLSLCLIFLGGRLVKREIEDDHE